MKNFTSLEQSKTLAEILPAEKADYHYVREVYDCMGNPVDGKWSNPKYGNPNNPDINYFVKDYVSYEEFPCWSLAALLDVLPKGEGIDTDLCFGGYKGDEYIEEWFCSYEVYDNHDIELQVTHADNPIDACYEMIIKLKEKGLL